MSEQIENHRLQTIAGEANTLWTAFVESLGSTHKPESLFHVVPSVTLNPVVLRFFTFCAELKLGAAVSPAFLIPTSTRGRSPAPTWLWHQGGGRPAILIDFDQIGHSFPADAQKQRTITRLILHEIGHMTLHYGSLRSQARGKVSSASPQQEQEAWAFAGIILGVALGGLARSGRTRVPPIIDGAWKFC